MPIRILLQTTLQSQTPDDWTIDRFSLLQNHLSSLQDDTAQPLCEVTARDRTPNPAGDDPILSQLDRGQFDELWLFALDVDGELSESDKAGIHRFHQQGGGILATRDHQDMGLSLCGLAGIGEFHYFHTQQCDPDESRACRDDCYTTYIDYPNYHSGANGDFQSIQPIAPIHELLKRSDGSTLQYFPAHPHEGGVGVSENASHARVIATGTSKVTGRSFNLAVASDRLQPTIGHRTFNTQQHPVGRVVAQSTFHHFVDYNWDIASGCPSFVDEPPGNSIQNNPQVLADIQHYVRNLALWLQPETSHF
jgi:hypothetical protein